jgi:predicted transcriptional regulator
MQEGGAETVRQFMEKAGLSQSQLAKQARVSQPTVSRALSKEPGRSGRARNKLFIFIHNKSSSNGGQKQGVVMQAFERIWDGSAVHAEAVAKVIDAMQGLKPSETPPKE